MLTDSQLFAIVKEIDPHKRCVPSDTRELADAISTYYENDWYLSKLRVLAAEKEAYERHAPKAPGVEIGRRFEITVDGSNWYPITEAQFPLYKDLKTRRVLVAYDPDAAPFDKPQPG